MRLRNGIFQKSVSLLLATLISACPIAENTVQVFAATTPTNVHVDDADSVLTAYIGTGNYNNGDKSAPQAKSVSPRTFYGWLKNVGGSLINLTPGTDKSFSIIHATGTNTTYVPNVTRLLAFDANGGTGTPTITSFNPDTGITITGSNGLSKDNYHFTQWEGLGASGNTITIPAETYTDQSYKAYWGADRKEDMIHFDKIEVRIYENLKNGASHDGSTYPKQDEYGYYAVAQNSNLTRYELTPEESATISNKVDFSARNYNAEKIRFIVTTKNNRPAKYEFEKLESIGSPHQTTGKIASNSYLCDTYGFYKIHIYADDKSDEHMIVGTDSVGLDRQEPNIYSVTSDYIGDPKTRPDGGRYYESGKIVINGAEDTGVGLHEKPYGIINYTPQNGGETEIINKWQTSNELIITKSGAYSVGTRDKCGNVRSDYVRVYNIGL